MQVNYARHTFDFYSCEGQKFQCFDLSNDTKIWEYICPPHTNPKVEGFFLTSMKLIRFPLNLERYFPNLKAIHLSENRITHISNKDLISHGKLEYLNLEKNKITSLDSDLFDGLLNLKAIFFSDNNIMHIGHNIQYPTTDVNLKHNTCIDDSYDYESIDRRLKLTALQKCPPKISQIEKVLEIRKNWLTSLRDRVEVLEEKQGMSPKDTTTAATTIDSTNTDEMCSLFWRPAQQ